MRQSNIYIILFAVGLTVVCGSLLALASKGLEPQKKANVLQENMSNILKTAGISVPDKEVASAFEEQVEPVVVNWKGEKLEGYDPLKIDLVKQYGIIKTALSKGKEPKEATLPIYKIKEAGSDKYKYFVFPVHGFGLWDRIWGYVCLKEDLNTVEGVIFDHKSETKGLGARIADDPKIRNGFEGKKVYDDKQVELQMMKGEQGNETYAEDDYKVDGMSGATLTGKGVTAMFQDYFGFFKKYIYQSQGGKARASALNQ